MTTLTPVVIDSVNTGNYGTYDPTNGPYSAEMDIWNPATASYSGANYTAGSTTVTGFSSTAGIEPGMDVYTWPDNIGNNPWPTVVSVGANSIVMSAPSAVTATNESSTEFGLTSSNYDETITSSPSTLSDGTVFTWSFPSQPNSNYVYAYPNVTYGNDPYFSPVNTVASLQAGSITNLSVTYNVSVTAATNSYDCLIETFATSVPNPSGSSSLMNEIGFLAHTPAIMEAYVLSLANHFNFSFDGFNAYIATTTGTIDTATPPYTIIMPVTAPGGTTPLDMISGTYTVPLSNILAALITHGILSPSSYISYYQFGFEIADGSGSATINSLSYDWNTVASTVAPTVSSVVASGSGITNGTGDLNAGHTVNLTVNMSEVVTVAGGTLTLTLNDGGTATYTGGSGSNALTFSYTVAAGQNTSDLAVTAVNLNSATVTDAAGNAANLTAAVTTPAGTLQIDTTAPTAPVISSDSPASGTAIALTGTAEANSTVTVYEGTSALGTVAANSAGAWSFTTGQLSNGSYTFTATATDAAGNVSAVSQPIDPTVGNVSAVSQPIDPTVGNNIYSANNTSLTITDTNDTVILSGSNDTVNLTGSNDAIQLSGSNNQLIITGSHNSVSVTGSNDSVSSNGADVVTFSGSGGNTVDATIGSGGNFNLADSLTGSGNDTLALTGNGGTINLNQLAHFSGFAGVSLSGSNDTLTLTNANLTVTRLSGSGDTIKLGTGIDTIAYTNVNQSTPSSHDTIIGFNASQDHIDFSAISGLNSNDQHVTINFLHSTPTSIAGHTIDVMTSGGSTEVYANATGSSESISSHQEDMQINLTGLIARNSSDFILHH
jgi:hypothetical protein